MSLSPQTDDIAMCTKAAPGGGGGEGGMGSHTMTANTCASEGETPLVAVGCETETEAEWRAAVTR